uniref:Replication-associated protein n=1 Tax=Red panda feces-associated circular DNA virus 9 TaxID=2863984 RepID=A0A8K1HI64_9VIRU|nr:replication-associated protein [Red panda feces-associated circular DNA virus 9]
MSIDNLRARAWTFTLNNYSKDDRTFVDDWCPRDCTYIVVGFEGGTDDVKTPHMQGYVEFANARRGSALRKLLGGSAHWEVRRATAKTASDYCKKGTQSHEEWSEMNTNGPNFGKNASVIEHGIISKQGKRTDLEDVAEAVVNKVPIAEIAAEHPGTYIRYHKGILALKMALMKHRDTKPTVIWKWGSAGVGKTRSAYESHKSIYIKDGTMWWDGYEQETAIIIDDFDGKWPYRDLLRLLDRYPYQGQIKGGYVPIKSDFIYITCEFHPYKYWSGNELEQVLRRLDKIEEVLPTPSKAL